MLSESCSSRSNGPSATFQRIDSCRGEIIVARYDEMVVVAAVVYLKGPGTESSASVSSSVYRDKPAAFDKPKK
jgi:hypothetical protein